MPPVGASITFLDSGSSILVQEEKEIVHHGRFHQSKPDIDNLQKAFLDSLMMAEDKQDRALWKFRKDGLTLK
jgi:Holliday junction resolvase RusA-like endonuclease